VRTVRRFLTVSLLLLSGIPAALAGSGVSARLASHLRVATPDEQILVWITFTDKGGTAAAKLALPEELVSRRALERRANVLPATHLVDETDLPLSATHLRAVEETGARIRNRSKWLNAVSAFVTPGMIDRIAELPGVASVDLVGRFPRDPVQRAGAVPGRESETNPRPVVGGDLGTSAQDYGPSLAQVSLLNIPSLHTRGIAGQGVIIGAFDNGFRLPGHTALSSMTILATRDFVDKKTSVVPNDPSAGTGAHGIHTLSTMGGFAPGNLIGPAYLATYILARTENDSSETPFEEDNWVAAIEWAESLGVQVTNTSLGYLTYDPPYTSWTWNDMNGRTTPITRAAAMAVRKGVVVVNSAGNNGIASDPSRNTLNAPADGDSVLAVGAVSSSGGRASFSSVGPTTSIPPRIKPDVMATGTSIYHASSTDPNGYSISQGTSFASPLAAGVAAMLLSVHPRATPMEIINALKSTASRASAPDNRYGWGIIDAVAALELLDSSEIPTLPSGIVIAQNFPNPFNAWTEIDYFLPEDADVTLKVFDLLGREVVTLVMQNEKMGWRVVVWDGTNSGGSPLASGVYFYRCEIRGISGAATVATKKMLFLR
jgi:serine protease AprX